MKRYPLGVRRPKLVLLAWAVVIGAMGFAIAVYPGIDINPTYKSMIMADDPDRAVDSEAKKTLADDELIVLAIENPKTVFDIPTIAYIDRLTNEIEKVPGVRKVYSLTQIDNIRAQDGTMVADNLITDLPKTQEDLARIEKEAFENPLYVNMIVAPDKKVASINVELTAGHSTKEDAEITERIYDIVAQAEQRKPPGVQTHLSGFPIASHLGANYMLQDMVTFSGLSMVVLVVIMFLVLRSWHGVIFTMFVALSSVSVTYGIMSLFGVKITMPLSAVMAFMTAIGMEYSVYVAFAYQHAVQTGQPGRPRGAALAEAFLDVGFTVVMSAACTSAAFGSMLTHPISDLKLQGTFLAIGTLTCCAAALTIIPAWIALFPFPVPPPGKIQHRRLQSLIDGIGRLDTRRPFLVMGGLALLIGVGVLLMTRMSSDTDAFQYFKSSSTIYQDDQFIRHRMAGDVLIPAIVTAKDVDTFKDPENLRKLDEIATYAASLPHVTKVVSHADHIKLMNKALHDGAPEQYKLPTTKQAVEQYLLLHNKPDDFHVWIDPDYKMASVMLRMDTMSSTILLDTQHKMEAFLKQTFPGFGANVVGTTLLVHRAFDVMAVSTLTGLVTATLFILLIMIIGFRSLRIGLLSLIPTLPPALMVYATLPLIGHPLDPPTSVTGAIALGIAIDDTTWFLRTWVTMRRKPGVDSPTAVGQTLSAIGRPMVLSSMVLGSGFAIMLFSRYGVLFWLGLMMALVAFWSIFWDVLCTPTIVRLIDPKTPRPLGSEAAEPPPASVDAPAA
ncbi:MAG TPA: MMPL family transporter [Kofleriaceae bacterium]|nr:MMPL family transporter [Kofleriaceae bacterium]